MEWVCVGPPNLRPHYFNKPMKTATTLTHNILYLCLHVIGINKIQITDGGRSMMLHVQASYIYGHVKLQFKQSALKNNGFAWRNKVKRL